MPPDNPVYQSYARCTDAIRKNLFAEFSYAAARLNWQLDYIGRERFPWRLTFTGVATGVIRASTATGIVALLNEHMDEIAEQMESDAERAQGMA